jgi:hypothetical protein
LVGVLRLTKQERTHMVKSKQPKPKTILVPSGPEPNAYEIQMPIPRPTQAQSEYVNENLFKDGPIRIATEVFPDSQVIVDEHTFARKGQTFGGEHTDKQLQNAPTIFSLNDLALLYAWVTLNGLIPHDQRSIMIRHKGIPEWEQAAVAIAETPDGTIHILYAEAFEHFPICDDPRTSDVSLLAVNLLDVEEFFKISGNINLLWRTQYDVWHMAETWTDLQAKDPGGN